MWHTKDFHHVNSKKLKKSTTVNWSKQCSKSTKSDTWSNRKRNLRPKKHLLAIEGAPMAVESLKWPLPIANQSHLKSAVVVTRTNCLAILVLKSITRRTIDCSKGQQRALIAVLSSRDSTIAPSTTSWIHIAKTAITTTEMGKISCHLAQGWFFKVRHSSWTATAVALKDACVTVPTMRAMAHCGTSWVASFPLAASKRATTITIQLAEKCVNNNHSIVQ